MVETFTPPEWLVEGVLQRRFVYSLTGQTGHAKTAIALHIAELVASTSIEGPKLGTHRVEKGRVFYLVGENPDDVTMRIIGSLSVRPQPHDWRIHFACGVFDIAASFAALSSAAMELRGVDLIVVDTSAAYYPGVDENSNTEIGAHARNLRTLTTLPGEPCVLVLCHPVKYITDVDHLLPRGGGAFLAEMDGNLTLRRISDGSGIIELHHNKIRGPGFDPLTFRLAKVTTEKLVDAKGNMIPTVRAEPVTAFEAEVEQGKSLDDEDHVLVAMLENPGASISSLAEFLSWFFSSGEPAKSRVQRALERLEKDRLVKKQRGTVWELTDAGKAAARKASLKPEFNENRTAYRTD
jgi:hypothetical protein